MAGLFDTQTLGSIASNALEITTTPTTETESTSPLTAVKAEMEEDFSKNIQNALVDNITAILQVSIIITVNRFQLKKYFLRAR